MSTGVSTRVVARPPTQAEIDAAARRRLERMPHRHSYVVTEQSRLVGRWKDADPAIAEELRAVTIPSIDGRKLPASVVERANVLDRELTKALQRLRDINARGDAAIEAHRRRCVQFTTMRTRIERSRTDLLAEWRERAPDTAEKIGNMAIVDVDVDAVTPAALSTAFDALAHAETALRDLVAACVAEEIRIQKRIVATERELDAASTAAARTDAAVLPQLHSAWEEAPVEAEPAVVDDAPETDPEFARLVRERAVLDIVERAAGPLGADVVDDLMARAALADERIAFEVVKTAARAAVESVNRDRSAAVNRRQRNARTAQQLLVELSPFEGADVDAVSAVLQRVIEDGETMPSDIRDRVRFVIAAATRRKLIDVLETCGAEFVSTDPSAERLRGVIRTVDGGEEFVSRVVVVGEKLVVTAEHDDGLDDATAYRHDLHNCQTYDTIVEQAERAGLGLNDEVGRGQVTPPVDVDAIDASAGEHETATDRTTRRTHTFAEEEDQLAMGAD